MKLFVFVTLLFAAASANPTKVFTTLKDLTSAQREEGRIIQGSPAAPGQFPWQVEVNFVVGGSNYFCGGALISNEYVLTAAHCADGASRFTLRFGSTKVGDGISRVTTHATVHEGYNDYLNNDIALIHIEDPIDYTDTIQPIQLGTDVVTTGETLRVSGWGRTSDSAPGISQTLNYVDLTSISNSECEGVYGPWTIISSTLCCRGNPSESTCNGDSGGPLVKLNSDGSATHVGVVSFVHINGCASGNPSGYVRTASLRSWITENSGV